LGKATSDLREYLTATDVQRTGTWKGDEMIKSSRFRAPSVPVERNPDPPARRMTRAPSEAA